MDAERHTYTHAYINTCMQTNILAHTFRKTISVNQVGTPVFFIIVLFSLPSTNWNSSLATHNKHKQLLLFYSVLISLFCRSVPSDSYYSYSDYYLTFAICDTDCNAYESFSSCYTQPSVDGRCYSNCNRYISVTCTRDNNYNWYDDDDYDDSSDSGFSSGGAVVGTTIGGLSICGIVVLLVICRIYVRHSLIRRLHYYTNCSV